MVFRVTEAACALEGKQAFADLYDGAFGVCINTTVLRVQIWITLVSSIVTLAYGALFLVRERRAAGSLNARTYRIRAVLCALAWPVAFVVISSFQLTEDPLNQPFLGHSIFVTAACCVATLPFWYGYFCAVMNQIKFIRSVGFLSGAGEGLDGLLDRVVKFLAMVRLPPTSLHLLSSPASFVSDMDKRFVFPRVALPSS